MEEIILLQDMEKLDIIKNITIKIIAFITPFILLKINGMHPFEITNYKLYELSLWINNGVQGFPGAVFVKKISLIGFVFIFISLFVIKKTKYKTKVLLNILGNIIFWLPIYYSTVKETFGGIHVVTPTYYTSIIITIIFFILQLLIIKKESKKTTK